MIVGNYFIITFIFGKDYTNDKQYCGTVIKKSDEEVTIKHGTRTELYLIVNFNGIGIKSINVETNTYFTKNKGDEVCFKLSDEDIYGRAKIQPLKEIGFFLFVGFMLCCSFVDFLLICMIISFTIESINKKLDK